MDFSEYLGSFLGHFWHQIYHSMPWILKMAFSRRKCFLSKLIFLVKLYSSINSFTGWFSRISPKGANSYSRLSSARDKMHFKCDTTSLCIDNRFSKDYWTKTYFKAKTKLQGQVEVLFANEYLFPSSISQTFTLIKIFK